MTSCGDRGGWCLSPAFDINSDPDAGLTLKTAVFEIHGSGLSIEAAVGVAPFFGISEDIAQSKVSGMAALISAKWREIGARFGMALDFGAVAAAFENGQVQTAIKLA